MSRRITSKRIRIGCTDSYPDAIAVGVDPGVHSIAFAVGSHFDGRLKGVGLARGGDIETLSSTLRADLDWHGVKLEPRGLTMVVEVPIIHRKTRDKNDIVSLALFAGIACAEGAARGASVETVWPKDWKGERPKDVHHAYLRGKVLSDKENAFLERFAKNNGLDIDATGSLMHNVLDAVGIFLWKVGRA